MKDYDFIKIYREKMGITSDHAVAMKVGVTRNFISMIRNNKCKVPDKMAATMIKQTNGEIMEDWCHLAQCRIMDIRLADNEGNNQRFKDSKYSTIKCLKISLLVPFLTVLFHSIYNQCGTRTRTSYNFVLSWV